MTLKHVHADYSDKHIHPPGLRQNGGECFCSLSLRSWLFLCSPLNSPHAHIPPPQCWWSQLLQSAICSIIFNYPAIAASIIPLSSILSRNHLLIDSKGQLEAEENSSLCSNYCWLVSHRLLTGPAIQRIVLLVLINVHFRVKGIHTVHLKWIPALKLLNDIFKFSLHAHGKKASKNLQRQVLRWYKFPSGKGSEPVSL